MQTRILLVDDHQVVRDGLRLVIREQSDMEIVGEAEHGVTALSETTRLQPDIIIMDIHLDDMSGIEVSRQVLGMNPKIKIIILSAYPDTELVNEAVEAGVSGYILKSNSSGEILQAIRIVMSGKMYLCSDATTALMLSYKKLIENKTLPTGPKLSERELDVLKLIAEGLRTKEIADRLNLGVKTVETHRANLMIKLKCASPVDLVKYALREGITTL